MDGALLRLARRALPHTGTIALAASVGLALSAGRYLRAWLAKPLLDEVLPGQGQLAWLLAVAAGLVLLIPALGYARAVWIERALARMRVEMERDLCARLLALPLRFHRDRKRGDLLARSLRDVDSAHLALRLLFGDLALSLTMLVAGAVTLFLVSWQLALLLLVPGPLLFLLVSRLGRRIRRSARRRQQSWSDLTQRLVEILEGIKVIQAFRAEDAERAAFGRATERLFQRSMRVVRQRVLARSSIEALNGMAALAVLALGALAVRTGRFGLSVGDLGAFAAALFTMYRPIKTVARGWVRLLDAQPAAVRFFEVLDAATRSQPPPGTLRPQRPPRHIELERVSFSYRQTPVLRDVSFELRAGERVALVGRSGAGKTTLVDLLLGFDAPDGGCIRIDGLDLRQIERDWWLEQIAVVTQEPFLFDGSLRDNLRYGRPGAGDAAVLAAARAARVDEFAERLPDGYETEVGAAGLRLSMGQRQRVAIGRALLRDPQVLIFDEATSSLDPESEQLVEQATRALLVGRTVLVIAHRLSTIRSADRIVLLEDGAVRQVGAPAELARRPGPYRELFALSGTDGA